MVMNEKVVGPYTVSDVGVDIGLDLMGLLATDAPAFQKQLLLASVKKDGKPIKSGSFGELVPHLAELISVSMEVNGFKSDSKK
jgi:hypothetical protein